MSSSDSRDGAAVLLRLLSGAGTTQIVYVAAELGVADLLVEGPRSTGELAAATGAHEPSLRKLLHAMAAIGLSEIMEQDTVRLTPAGARLASQGADSLHPWAVWWGRSLWQAWGGLLHSVRTGESARERLLGTRSFDHLAQHPENAAIFYRAMVQLSSLSLPKIVAAYDFARFRRIVDVGGGYGELLAGILGANPAARGVLFDLPQATAGARQHLDARGVGDRCEIVGGDFFVELPAGGDAYLLKSILHDWDDARAGRILSVCRRAMGEAARLVLVEAILPGPGEPADPAAALSDLNMLVALGAGERTKAQFAALLEGEGFAITRIVPIDGALHVIEAAPSPPA